MNKLFPLKKQILIKANSQEAVTTSGLILEGTTLVDSRTATVIRVGPDVTVVKPGYIVYVNWTKALPVKIEFKSGPIELGGNFPVIIFPSVVISFMDTVNLSIFPYLPDC